MHDGVKETLADIRSQYWIVGGRQLVRILIGKCSICRRFERKPYHAPPTPPLTDFRLREAQTFKGTGIDYLGPLCGHVREVKRFGYVFTHVVQQERCTWLLCQI